VSYRCGKRSFPSGTKKKKRSTKGREPDWPETYRDEIGASSFRVLPSMGSLPGRKSNLQSIPLTTQLEKARTGGSSSLGKKPLRKKPITLSASQGGGLETFYLYECNNGNCVHVGLKSIELRGQGETS